MIHSFAFVFCCLSVEIVVMSATQQDKIVQFWSKIQQRVDDASGVIEDMYMNPAVSGELKSIVKDIAAFRIELSLLGLNDQIDSLSTNSTNIPNTINVSHETNFNNIDNTKSNNINETMNNKTICHVIGPTETVGS